VHISDLAMVNMHTSHWYCLRDCWESRPAAGTDLTNRRTVFMYKMYVI